MLKDPKDLQKGDSTIGDGRTVKDKEEIIKIIDDGNANRKVAQTKMNVQSSRSHAVLQIVSEHSNTHYSKENPHQKSTFLALFSHHF